MTTTPVPVELTLQVADFLYREAALLDTEQYDEWLELCAKDIAYSIPQGAPDPVRRVGIANDNHRRLTERVIRLNSGFAYSQEPRSKVVHVIGNVRVLGHGAELVTVASNQVISEVRRGRQNLYTGLVEHDLRPVDAGYEIARKELRLVNSELPLGNLTFLL